MILGSKSAAHLDESQEWNVSQQSWNLKKTQVTVETLTWNSARKVLVPLTIRIVSANPTPSEDREKKSENPAKLLAPYANWRCSASVQRN